ncbi:MAG: hypothetical protein TE42_00035 [Candidatus Synechococcus spongiarum SP3]|uniref:Uncharacterized protein n=1 Tax=Candidatus Synechococcus spongiarum SP3 TaxID=1604020 RepID=A0A0G2HN72_9SYNE|nr:MAG: hypothetical protein TE42_00035 [Candidatus Synechococcus spongiarum SP3]
MLRLACPPCAAGKALQPTVQSATQSLDLVPYVLDLGFHLVDALLQPASCAMEGAHQKPQAATRMRAESSR